MEQKKRLSAVTYLDVLVVLPQVHKTVVCLDGFSKISDVSANNNEVLPDLPVFVITLKGFLQGSKSLISANDKKERQVRSRSINVLNRVLGSSRLGSFQNCLSLTGSRTNQVLIKNSPALLRFQARTDRRLLSRAKSLPLYLKSPHSQKLQKKKNQTKNTERHEHGLEWRTSHIFIWSIFIVCLFICTL